MGTIIACIDGSIYSDPVCTLSLWAASQRGCGITLLHVAAPHSDMVANGDLSGQIGLGAKSSLLKDLAKQDGDHGKQELKKGQKMLDQAKQKLAVDAVEPAEILHRRGSLVDTLVSLRGNADLVVMGRNSADHPSGANRTGASIEPVTRATARPVLVATGATPRPITRILLAHDGSDAGERALAFLLGDSLLAGMECCLMPLCKRSADTLDVMTQAKQALLAAGHAVTLLPNADRPTAEAIVAAVSDHAIDLLLIGAYSQNRFHTLLRGCATSELIRRLEIPILLLK